MTQPEQPLKSIILICVATDSAQDFIVGALTDAGYAVKTVPADSLLSVIRTENPHLVIADTGVLQNGEPSLLKTIQRIEEWVNPPAFFAWGGENSKFKSAKDYYASVAEKGGPDWHPPTELTEFSRRELLNFIKRVM